MEFPSHNVPVVQGFKVWSDTAWNPVVGCSRVSRGCKHCYAHNRLSTLYGESFTARENREELGLPFSWTYPRNVFLPHHGDLFHPNIKDEYVEIVLNICKTANQHKYHLYTRRVERAISFLCRDYPSNLMLFVSVGDNMTRQFLSLASVLPRWVANFSPLVEAPPTDPKYFNGVSWVIYDREYKCSTSRFFSEDIPIGHMLDSWVDSLFDIGVPVHFGGSELDILKSQRNDLFAELEMCNENHIIR